MANLLYFLTAFVKFVFLYKNAHFLKHLNIDHKIKKNRYHF